MAWSVNAGTSHNNSQSQHVFIALHDLWSQIYATDQWQMGFQIKFGNDYCWMSWINCFKVPNSGTGTILGSVTWATRRTWLKQSMKWSLWCAEGMQHKMLWRGIKLTDFSRVLGKLIKFLDFSRAEKHFFVFPSLSTNSQTAANPAMSYGMYFLGAKADMCPHGAAIFCCLSKLPQKK